MTTETNKKNLLEIKRFINAPRERVFNAWTRPEEMSQWLGGEHRACLFVTTDVQVGGQWQIRMKSAQVGETEFHGVYLAMKPPAKLVYTWCWKNHPLMGTGETLVTLELWNWTAAQRSICGTKASRTLNCATATWRVGVVVLSSWVNGCMSRRVFAKTEIVFKKENFLIRTR